MLKPETIKALRENGYDDLKECLHDLSDEYKEQIEKLGLED